MKKSKLIILPMIAAVTAMTVGCSVPDAADRAPVFDGVEPIDCLVGQSVDILDSVRVIDDEDGDITSAMTITLDGSKVEDGVVIFDTPGKYTADLYVKDSAGNEAESKLDITVHARDNYIEFDPEKGFSTVHSGVGTVTGGVKDGKYKVTAKGCDGDTVSLVRTFKADKDADATITYAFTSDVAGKAKIVADDETKEVDVEVGENTVSATYAAKGDSVTASLELGGLANAFEVNVDSVEISSESYIEKCGDSFVFEDTSVTAAYNGDRIEDVDWGVADDKKSGYLTVKPADGERQTYFAKMFIHTGIALKSGQRYQVSFDAAAEHGQDFEVTFNARNAEKKASDREEAMYGLHIDEGAAQTFAYDNVIAPESDRGELWIQISFGKVPDGFDSNTITVSNLSVKVQNAGVYSFADSGLTGKFDEGQGAIGAMTIENGVIHYTVQEFGAVDWSNELSSRPFTVDDTTGSYVMSFTAKSNVPVTAVFVIPTFGGWDPTLTWQKITIGTEEKEYRFLIDSVADVGPYYFVFQFGSFNTGIHDADIQISKIALEVKSEFERL